MAKIIKLDSSRKPLPDRLSHPGSCRHKSVIAYTVHRTVQCASCGAALDPFDVLVDMLKGYVPPDNGSEEQHRFEREVRKRREEKGKQR